MLKRVHDFLLLRHQHSPLPPSPDRYFRHFRRHGRTHGQPPGGSGPLASFAGLPRCVGPLATARGARIDPASGQTAPSRCSRRRRQQRPPPRPSAVKSGQHALCLVSGQAGAGQCLPLWKNAPISCSEEKKLTTVAFLQSELVTHDVRTNGRHQVH